MTWWRALEGPRPRWPDRQNDGTLLERSAARLNLTWPSVTATVQPAPESYDPVSLPPNVTITPAGRRKLEASRHRVITFSWNGTTIHGGIGAMEGAYDELATSVCGPNGLPCPFWIDPNDRWDIAARLGWNAGLFVPAAFFGPGFTSRRF